MENNVNSLDGYTTALFEVFGIQPLLVKEPYLHHGHLTFTLQVPDRDIQFSFLIDTATDTLEECKMFEGQNVSCRYGGIVPYELADELKFNLNGMC